MLNEAQRSEASGYRKRNHSRNPDPSAVPQDDAGRKVGFTLIELLVVIAVIALLMAILMPVLGKVRRQAQSLGCRSNLRQWGLGFQAYAAANDGKLPAWDIDELFKHRKGRYHTLEEMLGHIDYNDLWLCPRAGKPGSGAAGLGSTFICWRESDSEGEYFDSSYGFNRFPASYERASESERPYCWETLGMRGAGCIPAFFDCTGPYYPDLYLPFLGDAKEGLGAPPQLEEEWNEWDAGAHVCMNRHEGGINIAFLDGSVRKVGLKELWTLKWHKQYDTANKWTKAGGVQAGDWPAWMRRFKDY